MQVGRIEQVVRVLAGGGHDLRGLGVRIVQVSEGASAAAAVVHAGRHPVLVVFALEAQRALLDGVGLRVQLAHAVGAARQAALAVLGVHEHDAGLLVAVGGAGGAHLDAAGVLALLALHGQPVHLDVREGAHRAHGRHVVAHHAQVHLVLHLAGGHAGVAARAAVQVDDKRIFH